MSRIWQLPQGHLKKKMFFFPFSFPEYLDLVGLVSGHLLSSGNRDHS